MGMLILEGLQPWLWVGREPVGAWPGRLSHSAARRHNPSAIEQREFHVQTCQAGKGGSKRAKGDAEELYRWRSIGRKQMPAPAGRG